MTRTTVLADGIVLRLVATADAEPLAAAYRRNREHLAPWEPTRDERFFTTARHREEIDALLDTYDAGRGLPLVLADGDEIVGRVNVNNIVRGVFQSANLGYWVDAAYGGRGLATSAVVAVVELAREDLALHRLEAGTLVHNVRSQRVLERAGFEVIGVAPRYLKIAGEWQDHRLFQRILHD
ncbi:GNAT family N-acetyltransferase [Agromyces tardus]|uniref:GNAT family N-acetyltransferase n=1 Tax=Agromyces tardus TaxID=2583849 RepID=UPI001FE3B49A|nr:GNAT family N-acetyltransferase [Agromyces tardus]